MKSKIIFFSIIQLLFSNLFGQTTYNYSYTTIGASEASVIQGHLNNGDHVIVTSTGTFTNLQITSNILKSSGGDATLTIKSAFRVTMNINTSIRSTSNKLNIIFWSNSTNNSSTKGMIRFGDHTQPTANVVIETNGGHLWIGGGSTNTTWNGLTVGDGYAWGCASPGGNGWYGIELYGDCRFYTKGGNIAFRGRSSDQTSGQGSSFGIYVIKSIVNAGSGNIDVATLTDGTGATSATTTGIAIAGDGGFTSSTGNISIVNALNVASNTSGTATGVYLERNSTGTSSGNPVISSNQGSVNITTTMTTPASQKFFIDINELNFLRERASTAQQFTLPIRDIISGSSSTYSSSATSIATVNNSGLVTLVGTGSTDITGTFARSDWNSINSRYRYRLSVLNKADPNLSFSQSNIYKNISDASFTVTATQANQTGTVGSISYSSSNRSVATVNASTGQVTIVGQGSAVITATSSSTTTYVQGEASYVLYVSDGFVVLTTGITKSLTKVNLNGNVTSDGGNAVTERGFVYGTTTNPTISNTKIVVGSGTGSFSTTTPDLANGTYYFRAFATNITGTIYGSQFTERIDLSTLGCITILASGGVAEGTSSSAWSFSNNTIYPNSSTNLSINASDVLNKLSAGNLIITASCITVSSDISHTTNLKNLNFVSSGNIIVNSGITLNGAIGMAGSEIQINENLNTTSGGTNGGILTKANANISLAANKSITTNGGDVILWSDQDAANGGTISLLSTTSIQTNGGKIVLAGGLDNGSNSGTSNDGIPDGYARGLGVSGISTSGSFTINSGAGPIFMKGSSDNRDGISLSANASATGSINSSSGNIDLLGFVENGSVINGQSGGFIQAGIRTSGGGTINIESNTGTIRMEGNGPRYGLAFGVIIFDGTNYFASDGATQTIIKTANTSNNAITIKGNGQHGASFRGLVTKIHSTAALGGITLDAVSSSWTTTIYNPLEILAVSGPINWQNSTSTDGIGVFSLGAVSFGSKSGVSGLTSSSSNININIQKLTSGASPFAIGTSGQVNILGVNGTASFGQALNTSIFGLNSNSQTMTAFTFGASSNTQNLTFDQAISVAGPITAYGGTITVNGNITSSNGSAISLFGNSLTFGSNRTVTSTNGQLIIAPQTASNTIGLGGATGTFSLPASYFSDNFTDGFSNIQIGSSTQSGNIAANTFTIRDNITFLTSGSLSLGGKLVLGNNNITLGGSISSISASTSNYFQTNGNGKVISSLANNVSRLFPVGNAAYNPISINNKTGITDTFSVNLMDTAYLNGSSGGLIANPFVKRTWNISKNTASANAGSGVDLSFTWNANEVVGTLANPTLNHHNGSSWEIPTIGTSSVSGNTLSYTGYKGTFSPFAIGGSTTVALPVELNEFNAKCFDDYTFIKWTTASEKNNAFFELYKSEDAINWQKMYTTKGQGTKATETHYSFNDVDKKSSYYRLKDIDESGTENWSNIIATSCSDNVSLETTLYPNPAVEYVIIETTFEENSNYRIMDLNGMELLFGKIISEKTMVPVKDLLSGVYIIEINKNGTSINRKLIKK